MHGMNRRHFVFTAAAAAAGVAVAPAFAQQSPAQQSSGGGQGATQGAGQTSLGLVEPGQRKGKYFQQHGARIFYQTFGQGAPILLIHGYPLSGALFARAVDKLSQGNRVITMDLRGYGQSKAPGTPDKIEIYADDAFAVMDELHLDKATIGGMSMGGPITLAMYRKSPDRFSGMILIDTTANKASPAEAALWAGMATWVEREGVEPIIPFLLPQMLTGKTRMSQPAQVQYLTAIMEECARDAAIGGARALANRPDASDLLNRIDVPTLILVGLDDPLYSFELAQKMHKAIKGSELHVIPGAAHAAIFENADNAAKAIAAWAPARSASK